MTEKTNKLTGGGKKGGAQFPKFSLKHLIQYLNSLTSKTHSSTINLEQLNAGVFGISTSSSTGKIKSSALKQYGLLEGDYTKFKASELASKIALSTGEEQQKLLETSFGKVKAFNNAFNTFQNSKTDKTKIAQYAVSTLKVHPDFKDDFVKVLLESADAAGLCKVEGSTVLFEKNNTELAQESEGETEEGEEKVGNNDTGEDQIPPPQQAKIVNGLSSKVNVTIDVNSSMDPEKLEKLLKLLKNYGAI